MTYVFNMYFNQFYCSFYFALCEHRLANMDKLLLRIIGKHIFRSN